MTRIQAIAVTLVACALAGPALRADDVQYVEENGIRYQVTKRVVQRPINETRYEQRQSTTYRERYTTDFQEVNRTYQVPVTQQQWVPGYQKSWNVFAPPVLSYRLMPVTRWETRNETVRVPVTRRDLLPETLTQQVPVTTQRLVQDEHTSRVAVGVSGDGSSGGGLQAVAKRNNDLGGNNTPVDAARDDFSDQISRRK